MLLALSTTLISLALFTLLAQAAPEVASRFTIYVSLSADSKAGTQAISVSRSGSSLSGSKDWTSDNAEHKTTISGTIEKGLDGKERIIVDVADDWYRPPDPAVEGDSGW